MSATPNSPPDKDPHTIREMFAAIAGRYDLLNQLMTFGRHHAWRRGVIDRLRLSENQLVLDLGAGTGDLAFEAIARDESLLIVACDFTMEMLTLGKNRKGGDKIIWLCADAQRLPFPPQVIDRVVCGFLLRNLNDLPAGLEEQARVLKLGGSAAWLDTSPLSPGLLKPIISWYLRHFIPTAGAWLAGNRPAYGYLSKTSVSFQTAAQLTERIFEAGFEQVGWVKQMFGSVAIHWGSKPGN